MKKKKMSPSKTIFWVLITAILLCSAVLIYELQQDGVLNNKYIALAKVIPSQQDRWLSLFLFHEMNNLFPDLAIQVIEDPETGKSWKVMMKDVPEYHRQEISNRLKAIFNVLFGFGFYGEKRTFNEKDVYFLFRDLMPWFTLEVYFQPRYQVAIVIDDLGYNQTNAELFLKLPQKITYAIFPHLPLSRSLGKKFSENGKEIIIHLPMEALDSEQNNHATLMLKTGDDEARVNDIIKKAIASLPTARGLNNHKGSKATQDSKLMRSLMLALKNSDLWFLDSVTSDQSKAFNIAQEIGIVSFQRDIFIDGDSSVEYIKQKLWEAVSIAKKRGYSIAIGHVKPETYQALESFFHSFNDPEVEFVFLSELIQKSEKKNQNTP
ncbi:MAG: divergent polysaccharide deacetylase family protein [Candidatus Atribacteria bacterium]|nr:divergent polysaccharide deacetylase family protein [Candidatus Atribacteria bacterium]